MLTPEQRIEAYREHFLGRLKERYGIEISADDYVKICGEKINLIYKVSPNKRYGTITICGQEVHVIRDNAAKILNTCLPKDDPLPMPLRYKRKGRELEDFKKDLFRAVHKVNKLVAWIGSHKSENLSKDFFVTRPFKYKDWLYNAAWSKYKGKDTWISGIVDNLCLTCSTKKEKRIRPRKPRLSVLSACIEEVEKQIKSTI